MKRPLWPVVLAFPWRSLLYHTAVATSGCWKANAAVVSLWVQMLLRCGSSLWTLWHSSIPTIHCTVVQKWHRVVCFRFVFLYASRWPGRPLVCSKQYEKTKICPHLYHGSLHSLVARPTDKSHSRRPTTCVCHCTTGMNSLLCWLELQSQTNYSVLTSNRNVLSVLHMPGRLLWSNKHSLINGERKVPEVHECTFTSCGDIHFVRRGNLSERLSSPRS